MTSSSSRFSYKKDELVAGLQLNMTAAEMRARVRTLDISHIFPQASYSHLTNHDDVQVSRKKKADPRADKMDLKQKAAMIQNM